MEERPDKKFQKKELARFYLKLVQLSIFIVAIITITVFYLVLTPIQKQKPISRVATNSEVIEEINPDLVENGIHMLTGLAYDESFPIIRANCTACHSGKLIAQNRATREGWKEIIVWMQKTQKLWDLGENEPIILDYLAKYYAPDFQGRRKNLGSIDWYNLNI